MTIDLRSDTVTKPSKAMLEAMMTAPLGDDVFAEDPTIIELENYTAQLFGHEAALFCPSGTMTNQNIKSISPLKNSINLTINKKTTITKSK